MLILGNKVQLADSKFLLCYFYEWRMGEDFLEHTLRWPLYLETLVNAWIDISASKRLLD